ncbi:methyl-accepting chemotaxis protein [Roseateles sp.]|jgi:methyl-accepting chemotaxis protein|uniref:methyl-accepting chemotaxis protein n=1 Tax=Roseateles sp. TaxID=1971397 RepID=UPI0031DBEAC1
MTFLRQFATGIRLSLAFGLMLLLILAVSALGVSGSGRVFADLKTLYLDRTIPLKQIGEIDSLMLRNRILVTEMIRDPAQLPALDPQLQANIATITGLWKDYMATYLTDEEKRLATTFAEVRGNYVRQGLLPARDAVRDGDIAKAQAVYGERITTLGAQAKTAIDALLALQVRVGAESYHAAEATAASVRTWSLAAAAAAVLIALAAAFLTTRSITAPMQEAVQFAEAVAQGDLRTRDATAGQDEAARLIAALGAMAGSLRDIVSRVRHSSESIATGSSEIATGSLDLSQRTEEQASSLQQTAASMEELSSTVQNNASTAGHADQLATRAAEAAGQGGGVVLQVVRTMQDISTSSRQIADIIGVIDGIAFQTNILALNAAVEAARAGEQGKGFAVVASEVRALAQRSAQAAREIKALIGRSVEQVQSGSGLADEAGSAMQGIVEQVRQVSTLIGEIASASHEQSRGIQQIGQAVTQLDQVTQQNAALVEQSSAAADSLQQQAKELADLVRVFRLA